MAQLGKKAALAQIARRLHVGFPNLASGEYKITSRWTHDYNCLAWAAGDDTRRWDCGPPYYWPPGIPEDWRVSSVIAVLATVGYMPCSNFDVERGFEKVAIYTHQITGHATHFAIQLRAGRWSSKLGDWEDIEHSDLAQLDCHIYGTAVYAVKRKRSRLKKAADWLKRRIRRRWRDFWVTEPALLP